MRITREKALQLRKLIIKASTTLTDKEASEGAELLPQMGSNGELISFGTRINWNGKVKKAAVDLWDTEENNPDNAPTIWEDIEYREGYRIIPEEITFAKQFAQGERGWWKDELYESLVSGNVYTPEQYARNWIKVEKGET